MTSASPKAQTRGELIDEFAELDRKLKLWKPDLDRHAKLKSEILGWAEEEPADEAPTFRSRCHEVQLSKRANEGRIPSLLKIWQKVGSTKFLHHCSLTLKACRELIPTAEEDGLIVTEQVGARRIMAVVALKKAS